MQDFVGFIQEVDWIGGEAGSVPDSTPGGEADALLLENGTDGLLLEDGGGVLLLE